MSFQELYKQLCDFETQVISLTQNQPKSIRAPYTWPASLSPSLLPCFINEFPNFTRNFQGNDVWEYTGLVTLTLYSGIAGVDSDFLNQFDTMNYIERTVARLEAYPFLEISGAGLSQLTKPVQPQNPQPLVQNLRYAGNGPQLFWGGRVTCSLAIEINKDC